MPENEYTLYSGAQNLNGELANLSFDDDDEDYSQLESHEPEEGNDEQNYYQPQEEEQQPSLIDLLLRDKGISDSSKIKFADDNDNIQDVNWNDLSIEEQYNILTQQTNEPEDEEPQSPENELTEEEINFLNILRSNNITPEQYVEAVVNQQLENITPPEPVYEIDSLTDEELFLGDLQIRTPEITEEELLDALNKAKENPELFEKQIAGLRNEYQALEDQNREEQALLEQEQTQAQYQEFQQSIFDGIDSLTSLGDIDIELSDEDKEELAEYILSPDQNTGISQLQQDLADPATLSQVAWFLLKGQETIDGLIQYFTKEISKVRETYQQKPNQKPRVVVTQSRQSNSKKVSSIDDLD